MLLCFGRQQGGLIANLGRLAPTQLAGRQRAATPLRLARSIGGHAAQDVAEHPVADRPLLERVDVDRHGVLHTVDVARQREFQRPEEALHRVFEEADQVGEDDVIGGRWRQRSGDELGVFAALAGADLRRAQHGRVEAERDFRAPARRG